MKLFDRDVSKGQTWSDQQGGQPWFVSYGLMNWFVGHEPRKGNKQFEFWQRDSLAIHLYSKEVALQKLKYLHLNPLAERWQLAKEPSDYYWSSASFYDWGASPFGFLSDLRNEF